MRPLFWHTQEGNIYECSEASRIVWEIFKKKVVEHVATAIITAAVTFAGLLVALAWAVIKVPVYELRSPFPLIDPIILTPRRGKGAETVIIGAKTGVKLTDGVCLLSVVSGNFGAEWERIGVYPSADSEWVYDYRHGAAKIAGRIDCYSHPVLVEAK